MMKKMTTVLALVLAAILLCSSALAVSATYPNTQDFVRVLDEEGYKYTVAGIDDDGDERVDMKMSGDYWDYTIHFFFQEDGELVAIRIRNLLDIAEEDIPAAIKAVNDANYQYKVARFYVDKTDNTLTCDYDLVTRNGASVGECVLDAVGYLVSIIDDAHSRFAAFE